jgi:hypothetical protein
MDWTDVDFVAERMAEVEALGEREWALLREEALAVLGVLVTQLRSGRDAQP